MKPFTTEQMFHHDNQYDDENMSVGLWDAVHRAKITRGRYALHALFITGTHTWLACSDVMI